MIVQRRADELVSEIDRFIGSGYSLVVVLYVLECVSEELKVRMEGVRKDLARLEVQDG